MRRRRFLRLLGAGTLGACILPPRSVLARDETRLVVLHTNDTHSRIDPFPATDSSHAGLGGAARRAALVRRIRAEHPHVLLLDAGDIFQGTPYFNLFGGEIEFKTMSAMGYDAATLGNHDFDNGVDGLVAMLPHADFPFVSANYDVKASALSGHVRPWIIRELGGVRVGIFGLGISFERLVLAELHEGVVYTDPIEAARRSVESLRQAGCHLVIALSHLGHQSRSDRPTDTVVAQEVPGIDLLLGGHSHTFMDAPDRYDHGARGETLVHQVGFGGIRLGRFDLLFGADGRLRRWYAGQYAIDERYEVA